MIALEGARYRVISDTHNFFKPGEVVVALESSPAPYCIREEKYVLGCKMDDFDFEDYNPLIDNELEMLDDQPYLEDLEDW